MNYEKFNDAMCRLRQAEEDFNTALRDAYTAINEAFTTEWATNLKESQDVFCAGDEIICINENYKDYNKKLIYLGRNGRHIALCRLNDSKIQITDDLSNYQKTGKHYNVIF